MHAFLFNEDQQNIRYEFSGTKTAQQTFDSKSANCLSHAALYVATARYLNLPARFQDVNVTPTWEKEDEFYVVSRHMNAVMKLPGAYKATIEFAGTYLDAYKTEKTRIVNDREVLSDYYSNKGAEALANKNISLALAYFKKSISTWSRSVSAWSNMGVAYKIMGDYGNAEKAYLQALKFSPRQLSTANNLYALYQKTGDYEKAEKYFKRIEKYSKKNPYNLLKIANMDYVNGNYKQAERALLKAIKIKKNEPEFYQMLAKVYLKSKRI